MFEYRAEDFCDVVSLLATVGVVVVDVLLVVVDVVVLVDVVVVLVVVIVWGELEWREDTQIEVGSRLVCDDRESALFRVSMVLASDEVSLCITRNSHVLP